MWESRVGAVARMMARALATAPCVAWIAWIACLACGLSIAVPHPAGAQRVTGQVFDSIAGVPLRDATVQLVDRSSPARSIVTRTDGDGRFAFDTLASGVYLAGFTHPRLDSLLLASPVQQVEVSSKRDARLALFVPSRRGLATAMCGGRVAKTASGVLLGHVRPARTNAAPAKSRVLVQWTEVVIDQGLRRQVPTMLADTDPDGAFAICGLPTETRLIVQAWNARDTSGVVEVEMPAQGLAVRDLRVGAFERALISRAEAQGAAGDSASAIDSADVSDDSIAVIRGRGQLRGTVRVPEQGPIANARVTIRETGLSTLTDASGSFSLRLLPTGTHLLEAVAIGYEPIRMAVDIGEDPADPVEVGMRRVTSLTDTVRVFASRTHVPWLAGYESRKKAGMGRFIDETAIERMNPMLASDVLRMIPNVRVMAQGRSSRPRVFMRVPQGYCIPTLYVDHVLTETDGDFNFVVAATQLRAVEVYRSGLLAPAEFPGPPGCGVIVMWTGVRESPPVKR